MSAMLEEAIQDAVATGELEPGKVYWIHFRDLTVQLRVSKSQRDTPSPPEQELQQVMTEPWTDLTDSTQPFVIVRAQVGPPDLPEPPVIPSDEAES